IALVLWYLIKRPPLDLRAKIVLLLGLGVFPFFCAVSSTIVGMEATTHREFCGSCHVMAAHYSNASDPLAQSLAARHSRNPLFGDRSCYVCHADYGMYGYALTKAGGLRHVYMYYLGGYEKMPLPEFLATIHLRKPYDNTNCRQCHSGTLKNWQAVPDHESLRAQLLSNQVSCASAGCHGFAHPFTKKAYALPAAALLPTGGKASAASPTTQQAPESQR
ncbi:MAG: NapC/NirT family cytochrome c, partial [Polyangiaceae bacterium]